MKLVLLSLQLIVCLLACSPTWASETGSSKYVRIPVMYITDRAASAKGYGVQRQTERGTSIYNLNFGTATYSVKNSRDLQLAQKGKELGWLESEKAEPLAVKPLPGSGDDDAFGQFGRAISDTAANSNSKEAFVIVHGFNTTFASAVKSAAQLAYSVERPVIVYDWPSKGRVCQYAVDAGNNEWSQEHFNRLLEELKLVKKRSGVNFNLLAHSMGNRLAVRSAPVMKDQHIFENMYLVDPDFDAETFIHYLVRYARDVAPVEDSTAGGNKQEQAKVHILFSHRDRALPLAQFVFGGYTRLGQAADSMLSSVFSPMTLVSGFGHQNSLAKGVDKMPADVKEEWAVKFEWIDFTALDRGLIGHTIPFDLIASLWSTNTPGDGLKLVESVNDSPNRLSKLFLAMFREKEHISDKLGVCKRVALIKDEKHELAGSGNFK